MLSIGCQALESLSFPIPVKTGRDLFDTFITVSHGLRDLSIKASFPLTFDEAQTLIQGQPC